MNDLRVLIVGDDLLTSAGLAAVLAGDPELQVVGQVETGADWGETLERFDPHVVVWDLGWEAGEALQDALEQTRAFPPLLALVTDTGQVHQMWTAGVRGILPRDVDLGALRAAIHALTTGLAVFDPEILRGLVSPRGEGTGGPESPLTPRETEVLRLLADGLTNRGIASELQISEHTVKFHVNSIMGKLNAESRTEAAVIAMRKGIISF